MQYVCYCAYYLYLLLSAERLHKLQISSADILPTFCRHPADILQTILQIICRPSADLLQMFQQICSRLKTDLLVSYGNGPIQLWILKENYKVSWKKSLDYNMYVEKSFWLVDSLNVLVIYQYNEPFKIIGVFNHYNMLSLTFWEGTLSDTEIMLFIC